MEGNDNRLHTREGFTSMLTLAQEELILRGASPTNHPIKKETKPFLGIWRKPHGCRSSYSWGKFNHPDIRFEGRSTACKRYRGFLDWTDDNFLTQVINKPTRGGALLDLLLTKQEALVGGVKVKGSPATRWQSL